MDELPDITGKQLSKLINLFKIIVITVSIAITTIVSVGLFFSYKDMSEMRAEVRQQAREMKDDFNSQTKSLSDQLQEFRNYSERQITQQQNYSIDQLERIRTTALTQAQLSVKDEIQTVLKNDIQVSNFIQAAKDDIGKLNGTIGIVNMAVAKIATLQGHRKDVLLIDSICNADNQDMIVKSYCGQLLEKVNHDLRRVYGVRTYGYDDAEKKGSDFIKSQISAFRNEEWLSEIILALNSLEIELGMEFSYLDFDDVERKIAPIEEGLKNANN